MKIVITVTDDQAVVSTHTTDSDAQVVAANGHAEPQVFDGGSVPELLLSMEGEVAAGHRPPPGQPR